MADDEGRRRQLAALYHEAVNAAGPECLDGFLPPPPSGRLFLLAGGKAAAPMAARALAYYHNKLPRERLNGVVVTKPGVAGDLDGLPLIGAGHPVPDAGSQQGALRMLGLAQSAGPDDLVLLLLSGGASALLSAPAAGLSLADKQAVTKQLLRSGAAIGEINTVRKHLSRIKGGRLAAAAFPARTFTLAFSDVAGDDPAVIGSGPTVGDPSTLADAREIIDRYSIEQETSLREVLNDAANETVKPGDPRLVQSQWRCVASGATALKAVAAKLGKNGFRVIDLGDRVEGEARKVARDHARLALDQAAEGPVAILSGGELTVSVRGAGRGGPSQEYALAFLMALDGAQGISALVADTDGCDGGAGLVTDPAGAFIFPSSLCRALENKLNPATFLDNNDSGSFFEQIGDLLVTGPTGTNVNDFRVILVDGADRATETDS